jgi:hypothetical protein
MIASMNQGRAARASGRVRGISASREGSQWLASASMSEQPPGGRMVARGEGMRRPGDSVKGAAGVNGASAADVAIAEADAAFEAGLERLETKLRAAHPELFDESGALCLEAALRLLARQVNGKEVLSRSELLALTGARSRRIPDAP